MTIDLRNTKIRINSEQESELFQNFAYDTQGAKWVSQTLGEFEPRYIEKPFLFIDEELNFSYASNNGTFETFEGREVTLEQLGLTEDAKVDSKKESEILKFLNYNSFELKRMMDNEQPLFLAVNKVIGVLLEKYEPKTKITEPEKVVEQEVEEQWRFKTLDEIKNEGLGYSGLREQTISRFTGKKLTELDNTYGIDQTIKNIENNGSASISGFTFSYQYFTKEPIKEIIQQGYSLLVETIPSTLKRDYPFSRNRKDRQSPSQSAGDLYRRYAALPDAKLELLNTFFKGNDDQWWNLQQVSGTWRWEKSSPQPTQTTSTAGSQSTTTTQEPAKKEWVPQDLVGKTLLFTSSSKKYLVEKFTRNNPKNKEYKLRDLTSLATPEVTYKISMSLVKKWLDGQTASGVRIFEEQPSGTNYSTWSQSQLIAKRKEISDALIAFEEDDPEYKELKQQLDVIDAFID